MLKKLKKAIHRFLINLAKQNEELYGKGKMDCCKLNKADKR